jgi:hypothetical protein
MAPRHHAEYLNDERGAIIRILIRHLAHRCRHGVFAAQRWYTAQGLSDLHKGTANFVGHLIGRQRRKVASVRTHQATFDWARSHQLQGSKAKAIPSADHLFPMHRLKLKVVSRVTLGRILLNQYTAMGIYKTINKTQRGF